MSWLLLLSLGLLTACRGVGAPEVEQVPALDPIGSPDDHLGRLGVPLWTVMLVEGRPDGGVAGHQRLGQVLVRRVNGVVLPAEVRLPMSNRNLDWLWPVNDSEDLGEKAFFAFETVEAFGFAEGQYAVPVAGKPLYPVWRHELRILRPEGVWEDWRRYLTGEAGLEPWWEPDSAAEPQWRPRD